MKRKDTVKEAWIRILGLPLHLWTNKILRRFSDACGGFIKLDMKTTLRRELLWARILVSLEGKERSRVINVEVSSRSYELQVWWEILSWIFGVFPLKSSRGDGGQPREEEDEAQTCTSRSTSRKIGSGSGDFQRC